MSTPPADATVLSSESRFRAPWRCTVTVWIVGSTGFGAGVTARREDQPMAVERERSLGSVALQPTLDHLEQALDGLVSADEDPLPTGLLEGAVARAMNRARRILRRD